MAGVEGDVAPTWRVTGRRTWLHVLLLVLFVGQAVFRLVELMTEPPPHYGDGILFVVWLIGALCYGLVVLQHQRTRVTLLSHGLEVHVLRRRLVPYVDIERAYRDRWSRSAVTLDLLDASKVVLPAPVAGLKDPAPELDEAVALINERVRAARPDVAEDAAG